MAFSHKLNESQARSLSRLLFANQKPKTRFSKTQVCLPEKVALCAAAALSLRDGQAARALLLLSHWRSSPTLELDQTSALLVGQAHSLSSVIAAPSDVWREDRDRYRV